VLSVLLAFAGGVVAVALKGYVDLLLDRRREKRAVQVAARLVYEELWGATMGIEGDLFIHKLPRAAWFTTSAWDENKALLAPAMTFESWRNMATGYGSMLDARELAEREAPDGFATRELDADDGKIYQVFLDLQHSLSISLDAVAELIEGHERDPYPALLSSRPDDDDESDG
jgi:hypothetical protein